MCAKSGGKKPSEHVTRGGGQRTTCIRRALDAISFIKIKIHEATFIMPGGAFTRNHHECAKNQRMMHAQRKGEGKCSWMLLSLFFSLFCTILFAIKLDFDSGHLSLFASRASNCSPERSCWVFIHLSPSVPRRTMSNACLHASSHINAARDALKNTIFMDSTLSGAASRKFRNLCRAHSSIKRRDAL